MKVLTIVLSIVLSLALVSGCTMAVDPSLQFQKPSNQIEPEAGQWQTWVLASSDELRPQAPPDQAATKAEIAELKALAAKRDAAAEDIVAYWDAGSPSYHWIDMAVASFAKAKIPPSPIFSRGLSLMNVAVYDAMVTAWKAKYTYNRARPSEVDSALTTLIATPNSPSYPSEHAVAAGAASTILSYLFPDDAELYAAKAEEEAQSRLLAGVQFPSDVTAGLALGRAVAEKVIERAKADGADAKWDGTMPTEAGHWTGKNPVDPLAGTWKTWVLTSGDQLRPPPPPAYDSAQEQAELMALETFTHTLASDTAAFFWNSPAGGPAYWYNLASRRLFEHRMDLNPPMAARLYAAVTVAQYDAQVACYDAKYTYWAIRPFQLDPKFKPLVPTPNHPSYPSAHSCQSGAMATVLAAFFPAEGEATLKVVDDVSNARVWAGIHFQSDVDAGQALGEAVGKLVVEHVDAMMPK